MMTPDEHIENFQARVLHDAWLEGTRIYWERRARQLEAARPRRGDYTGEAATADIAARWDRLTATAAACRARATLTDLSASQLLETLDDLTTPGAAA